MKSVRQHIINQCFWKYLSNKKRPISPELQELFDMGNEGERLAIERMHSAGEGQEPISHPVTDGINIVGFIIGHPDYLVNGFLGYEIKITNQENITKLPYKNHIRQTAFYSFVCGVPFVIKYYRLEDKRLLLVWDHFIDGSKHIELILQFEERALEWWNLDWETGDPREISGSMLCNPIDDQECWWCNYKREGVCPKYG